MRSVYATIGLSLLASSAIAQPCRNESSNTSLETAEVLSAGSEEHYLPNRCVDPARNQGFFRFTITRPKFVQAVLFDLKGDGDLCFLDNGARELSCSDLPGSRTEGVGLMFQPGTYFARVRGKGSATPYVLHLLSDATAPSISPPAGAAIALSGLVSFMPPPLNIEVHRSNSGSPYGHFLVNGVPHQGPLRVSAQEYAGVRFLTGAPGVTESIFIRAQQTTGWEVFKPFRITTAAPKPM